nr:hypothetical protein [Tanacetum cinerariifolium]
NENVELEFQVLNYAKENAHLKTTYKNLFDSISMTRTQTKTIIKSLQNKLHDTIYENTKLRAQLFDKASEQKDTTRGTSVNTKFAKQSILGKPPSSSRPKLYAVTLLPKFTVFPKVCETYALSKPVTSNSIPTPQESKFMKNDKVIAPGMFKINPFKPSREEKFAPNKHVKASIRTKPIIVSQPHVITKNDVKSKTNGFLPKDVKITTKTRRPLPRNNPNNDTAPSKSKSRTDQQKVSKFNFLYDSNSDHEDANEHTEKFLEIVDLFHILNITIDQVILGAFFMSLTGATSRWLRNEPTGSITTYDGLKTKFLNKYGPPARNAKKMEEINNFQQEPDENLYQAWERFKEFLIKYPQHYLTEMHEVILFYNGLGIPTRQILDSRGAIPSKTVADAKAAIQEMAGYS